MRTLILWLGLIAIAVPQAHASPSILVSSASELQAALVPANAGRTIVVRAGDYEVSQPLVVPEGATLTGEGVMNLGEDGLPVGFRDGTRTTLRGAATLVGDILTLGHGTSLSRLAIEDQPGRSGNLLVVSSRSAGDVVSAFVDECELVNPNPAAAAFNGPTGRGLLVITRNPRQLSSPAPHEGSSIAVLMRFSIARSPADGSGVMAINFAPHAQVSVDLERNVIGGGLDAHGGVSRPVSVVGSATRIASRGNLYRADSGNADVGWVLGGGSGPPIPLAVGSTSSNLLAMDSTEDRIEGFRYGINAAAGQRWFGPPIAGTSDENRATLSLRGTRIASSVGDLVLFGAIAPSQTVTPGDGNVLHVELRGVAGSGASGNMYAHVTGPTSVLGPPLSGYGNRVEIEGSPVQLLRGGIDPPPPTDMFIGP
jgi:hypothetical protein